MPISWVSVGARLYDRSLLLHTRFSGSCRGWSYWLWWNWWLLWLFCRCLDWARSTCLCARFSMGLQMKSVATQFWTTGCFNYIWPRLVAFLGDLCWTPHSWPGVIHGNSLSRYKFLQISCPLSVMLKLLYMLAVLHLLKVTVARCWTLQSSTWGQLCAVY